VGLGLGVNISGAVLSAHVRNPGAGLRGGLLRPRLGPIRLRRGPASPRRGRGGGAGHPGVAPVGGQRAPGQTPLGPRSRTASVGEGPRTPPELLSPCLTLYCNSRPTSQVGFPILRGFRLLASSPPPLGTMLSPLHPVRPV
jgi:hypothetical protein